MECISIHVRNRRRIYMAGQQRSQHDKQRAAMLKAFGIERTTGRCAKCYNLVTVDNAVKNTRFTHRCFNNT